MTFPVWVPAMSQTNPCPIMTAHGSNKVQEKQYKRKYKKQTTHLFKAASFFCVISHVVNLVLVMLHIVVMTYMIYDIMMV